MRLSFRLPATLALVLGLAACAGIPSPSRPPAATSPASPGTTASATSPSSPVQPTETRAAPTATERRPPSGGLEWMPCQSGAECATVDAPLDYADRDADVVSIALLRIPATDPTGRIGSIVYNPGGPGASGVETIANFGTSIFSEDARERFDIVGFDPRGVGDSDPVRCLDRRPELDEAFPDEPSEIERWLDIARKVADACVANSGELLPHVGTQDVVRDLDRIRAALGDEKLTYLGQSYGTLIGELYADEFPESVRAIVLDAVLDPSLEGAAMIAGQAAAMEAALDRFLASCDEDPSCPLTRNGPAADAFDRLMAGFEDQPVAGVSGNVAWNAIAILLIQANWDALTSALASAIDGDPSQLGAIGAFGTDRELVDGYDAVACLDFPVGHSADAYEQLARELDRSAPRMGRFLTYSPGWGSVDCAFWPVVAQRQPQPLDALDAPPMLVIGGTGDPATPYDWAISTADQLPSSALLTREGEGHVSYSRNACIGTYTDAYLIDLQLPAPETICSD
jgi:pimeloyl-ACP methyl ester carboxylesterase